MDIAILFCTCVVVLGVASIQNQLTRSDRRVARVERKIDAVMRHLDLEEEVPRKDEILTLVRDGKQVQAIKLYREATGAGLVEAKQAVDAMS
ncbi:ribosomal protein L7/L12 [Streptomyces sp. PAM3C]|uniref:ribosomal protein L7/L12 n=1 Tax=Streptomyces sp. PAM3C TaxID=2847300 RepID=UPI001C1E55E4|nr:ribosomal protein L7/L12 [Streptomyces sp. PAM3C]MBU5945095.1 ribosomal protein L7/L12 [Streptomyces sp. PAM3C]